MNCLPLLLCIPLTICESQSQPRKHSAISSFSPTPQLETRCQVNIEHHLENCLAQVRSNFGAGQLKKSVDPAAMALTSWAKTSSPGSCCSSRKGTLRASKSLGTSWHTLNAGTNSPLSGGTDDQQLSHPKRPRRQIKVHKTYLQQSTRVVPKFYALPAKGQPRTVADSYCCTCPKPTVGLHGSILLEYLFIYSRG